MAKLWVSFGQERKDNGSVDNTLPVIGESLQRQSERFKARGRVVAEAPGRTTAAAARFALFFTVAAWIGYLVEQSTRVAHSSLTTQALIETSVYVTLVTLLTMSAAAYLLARIGYFGRTRSHRRVPRSTIDNFFDEAMPSLSVLVPSYREDYRIIRQTLLSAAAQEYPHLRVVLLIDDPPNPESREQAEQLRRARDLPEELSAALKKPRLEFEHALEAFERETTTDAFASSDTLVALAEQYERATAWFLTEAQEMPRVDHTDDFVAHEFLGRMAEDLRMTAEALHEAAGGSNAKISRRRVHQLYARLVRIFQAEITSFERKQFASLSHEANKAMNLNSYIGLMGGSFAIVQSPGGKVLVPAGKQHADLAIADSQYILTLDADSVLLPEYCLRLVYFLEQPENADVAVVQTPYSAYPNPSSRIERIAGATTDIQHIVHQGLTSHGATFWVGANAVIRKRAIEELEEQEDEAGFVIRRFIKDRTVIEDTESSVDLRARGWRLHNYPERLSYSATPPDFGALVIQRQRWANGGLVILPKLWRLWRTSRGEHGRVSWQELFLRFNYLASISWASLGLLVLLFYPFDGQLLSRFAVFTALPYFWAMATDLKRVGYRWFDILGVYGFNLLLLPVNLAGTVQSIAQGIGGQKMAFARTPKVQNRTVAPFTFLAVPVFLIAWSTRTLSIDLEHGAYVHGAFASVNLVMTLYAVLLFIGVVPLVVDLTVNAKAFVYRPRKVPEPARRVPHWASVLYVGSAVPEEVERSAPIAVALAADDQFSNRNDASAPMAAANTARRTSTGTRRERAATAQAGPDA